jgi:hypothetical protein
MWELVWSPRRSESVANQSRRRRGARPRPLPRSPRPALRSRGGLC